MSIIKLEFMGDVLTIKKVPTTFTELVNSIIKFFGNRIKNGFDI